MVTLAGLIVVLMMMINEIMRYLNNKSVWVRLIVIGYYWTFIVATIVIKLFDRTNKEYSLMIVLATVLFVLPMIISYISP